MCSPAALCALKNPALGWTPISRAPRPPRRWCSWTSKRRSPDPEASFNAALPVFFLCCTLFFGIPVFFGEKNVLVLSPECIPLRSIMRFPGRWSYARVWNDAGAQRRRFFPGLRGWQDARAEQGAASWLIALTRAWDVLHPSQTSAGCWLHRYQGWWAARLGAGAPHGLPAIPQDSLFLQTRVSER